jgi:mannose/fructose/N-acetylgalactosamine-specific phosphotransferase system component IID
MENPPAIAGETDPIADLGDEAFWMSMGPIVRVGDTVIWITVNPKVENQREVGIALARIAIDRI